MGQVAFRYHLENDSPVELLDFTRSLEALHNEYSSYLRKRELLTPLTRLNIHKVEHGSIIVEIIEAIAPVTAVVSEFNTLIEFSRYLKSMIEALAGGRTVPEEGKNSSSLQRITEIVAPLAKNPNSNLEITAVDLGSNNIFDGCTFNIDTMGANAIQNVANSARQELERETNSTEELKRRVLLRFSQINPDEKSKGDRGIIEAFLPNTKKKLLIDEEVKRWFMDADENLFKYYYYVDAVAMYQEGKIVAYKIIKVYEKFLEE